jgi:hypothetical protein
MPAFKATDDEIVAAYKAHNCNADSAAHAVGISVRVFHSRMAAIEARIGAPIREGKKATVVISRSTKPNAIDLQDGVIMVCSDCHWWPGEVSTANRAFVKLAATLKPWAVIVNGDEFDGASISRHGRSGWEQRPTVAAELREVGERLDEIAQAAPRAHKLGTYGNHTMRFDTYLSAHAPHVEGTAGMTWDDRFPDWRYAWAWMVNGHTLIKHRIKGGIHATWNNTADAQVSTVTGHLHNLRVTPRTTMSPLNGGNIFGVDCGMLADPWGPQFAYVEQGPRNWRSGFVVLTFHDGHLMPPEICQVVEEGAVFFRGKRIEV